MCKVWMQRQHLNKLYKFWDVLWFSLGTLFSCYENDNDNDNDKNSLFSDMSVHIT